MPDNVSPFLDRDCTYGMMLLAFAIGLLVAYNYARKKEPE